MSRLNINKKKCVHCGACTAACGKGALFMEKKAWTLAYDELLCIRCNACLKACPLRAISTESSV